MPPPPWSPKKEAAEDENKASPSSIENGSDKYDPDGDVHRYLNFSQQEPLPVNAALPPPATHEAAVPVDAQPSEAVSWDLDVIGPIIAAFSQARVDRDGARGNSSNSTEELIEPTFMQFLPGQLDCSACMMLRELMHTNGREYITLAIHGDLGVFYHALFSIEEMIDIGVSNHKYFYLDITEQNHDWMKTFMIQYNRNMLNDGFLLVRDKTSAFIDALCGGISTAASGSLPPGVTEPATGTAKSTLVGHTSAAGTSNSGMKTTDGDAKPAVIVPASASARRSKPADHNATKKRAHPAARGSSSTAEAKFQPSSDAISGGASLEARVSSSAAAATSAVQTTPAATASNSTAARTPEVETHEAGPSQADANAAAERSRRGKAAERFIPSAAPPRSSRRAPTTSTAAEAGSSSRSHLGGRTNDSLRRRTLGVSAGEGTSRSGVHVGGPRVRIPKTGMALQRERTGNMRLEDLCGVFHLPIVKAARQLSMCSSALKHICRRNGMPRWPQRKINSIDKKMKKLEENLPNCRSSERAAEILAEIEKLKEKRARLCTGEREEQ